MSETGTVADDAVNHRLVLEAGGDEAELVYHRNGPRLVLVHTEVPGSMSGQGVGGRLVARALEWAERDGLVLVPVCPYARHWLETHPDRAAAVQVDWPGEP